MSHPTPHSIIPFIAVSLVFLLLPAHGESGPSIPLRNADPITLPQRFVLSDEGIRFVIPNDMEVVKIRWQDIDLARFALAEPELNRLREQVLLLGERELVEVSPAPNYFREFLDSPLNIRFNQEFSRESQFRYRYHLQPHRSGSSPENHPHNQDSFTVTGGGQEREVISELTRPEFNSTVEGFLLMISDSSTSRSRRLIRDLREHQSLYANLIIGMQNLQKAYPDSREILIGTQALEQFSRSSTISIDDQNSLARFLQFARVQAEK